jgi:hypothetical protein
MMTLKLWEALGIRLSCIYVTYIISFLSMSSISERAWELNSFFLANFLQENNINLLKKTPIFPFFSEKKLPKIGKKI